MSETIDCPKCGHEHDGNYEIVDGEETECQQCGFKFTVHTELVMTYQTECVEHEHGEWTTHKTTRGDVVEARFCKHCWACELRG